MASQNVSPSLRVEVHIEIQEIQDNFVLTWLSIVDHGHLFCFLLLLFFFVIFIGGGGW